MIPAFAEMTVEVAGITEEAAGWGCGSHLHLLHHDGAVFADAADEFFVGAEVHAPDAVAFENALVGSEHGGWCAGC